MMKSAFVILIVVLFTSKVYSQDTKLIVWSDDFECILNQNLIQNSFNDIVAKIVDTMSNKYFYTTNYESVDKVIKMPMTRHLIVYKGAEISREEIKNNSQYLKSYEEHNFYLENPEWYSRIQLNDTLIMQVSNQDKGPLQTKTQLTNGSWFLFGVLENESYLIKEINIVNHNIHGYLKIYENADSSILKMLKFKNGVLVDTLAIFNNGVLSSYEIRDSLGIKLLISASYYPNSQNFASLTDYVMGYAFTFFENGVISSMVRIKNYAETGFLLEFDKEGNVIKKTLSLEH